MASKPSSLVEQALNKVENTDSQSEKPPTQKENYPQGELEKLQHSHEELKEELDMLAYAVSHDLATNLRHLISYATLLGRKIETHEDPDIQKYSELIQDAGLSLNGRMGAILDYSRLSRRALKVEEVDTQKIIEELCSRYSKEFELRKLDCQVTSLPTVHTDRYLFLVIFRHLLENSLHFTSTTDTPVIQISAIQESGRSCFTIQDNGVGLEENAFERMTRLFQQGSHMDLPNSPKSFGVGLSMVKRAVHMLGGGFSHSVSESGETCFHVSLPELA